MRRPLSRGMRRQLSLDSISTCKPGLLRRQPPQGLKNNMEVEAAMEMQQHLDETGLSLHLLCMSCFWVCTMFDQSLLSLH